MAHFSTMNKRKKDGKPNDEWITPEELVKKQIKMVDEQARPTDVWFDPFKNTGRYYNAFPTDNKVYTEILEGKDFFEYDGEVDIMCSNPPYSMWKDIYKKTLELNPRIISFVMAEPALTRARMCNMESAGYKITKIHKFDVKRCTKEQWSRGYRDWMVSIVVQWEKTTEEVVTAWTWDKEPYPFEEKSEEYHIEAKEFRDMLYQTKNFIAIHNAEQLIK